MKTILTKLSKLQNAVIADKDQTNKFGGYGYRTKEGILSKTKHIVKNLIVQLWCQIKQNLLENGST